MRLSDLVRPWKGPALRHIPAGSPFGPLDARFAGLEGDNRWNEAGQPAIYFARDRGVVVAEFGRHMHRERSTELAGVTVARAIFSVELTLEGLIDLRDPAILGALSLDEESPGCFLDRDRSRATAQYLLAHTPVQALLVPSMAFLDDPERWSLVVYLDRVDLRRVVIGGPSREETLVLQRN